MNDFAFGILVGVMACLGLANIGIFILKILIGTNP